VACEEKLQLQLPRRSMLQVARRHFCNMTGDAFAPPQAVARASREGFKRNAEGLTLARRWHLEWFPQRLLAVHAVRDERDGP
jgi:hypothetical protein